ncbi:MAG: nitrile hydratase subunit beta [Geminicoccaceae bacterium]
MNGGQDLGGMMGFGPVRPEPGEPVFHAAWERRVFALTLAMARPGGWNIDQSRFARESSIPVATSPRAITRSGSPWARAAARRTGPGDGG